MRDRCTELELIQEVVDYRLQGKSKVYRDDMADMRRVLIRWDKYRGQVAWSEDERGYNTEHWVGIIRNRAESVVNDILRLKEREEREEAERAKEAQWMCRWFNAVSEGAAQAEK